jgi:hypothetical protein
MGVYIMGKRGEKEKRGDFICAFFGHTFVLLFI